jgi:RND superfamily putative drug exporter
MTRSVVLPVKALHDRGLSNEEAVALGLQRTGRIVTFAALRMVIAIGCFVTALMRLLGDWNWCVPRPLARLLPA